MYFSGFCLKQEEYFFDLNLGEFDIAGFSYGAIKALEFTKKRLLDNKRVNKLILLSPAFFEDKDENFKQNQLNSFSKNKKLYLQYFLKNISYPSNLDLSIFLDNSCEIEDLKRLLYYRWNRDDFLFLKKRGVIIEVYLGEKDKIININKALEFFKNISEVYFIKSVGHILKGVEN